MIITVVTVHILPLYETMFSLFSVMFIVYMRCFLYYFSLLNSTPISFDHHCHHLAEANDSNEARFQFLEIY